MALLNIFRGTDAEVSSRPVSDGALLFATDTKKIYLDKGSSRIEMTFKQDLSDYVTDSELAGLLAGKADTVHTHDAADVATGTFDAERIPTITDDKIASVSAEKITGTIPSENLPSYVDDVVEVDNYAALPPTGEAGKIYVDKETNKTYRWGGSAYVEISASLALGETSSTAFRGDYGKVAYDHAQAKGSEFATGLYKISTNAEGHVTSATAVTKGDITALGIPSEDTNTTYTAGSGLALSGTEFGIADGGIIGRHLDDNCVMERNIAVGSVTSDKIPALAITTPKLVDNAVTAIKMADDAVATRSIQDGAVTAEKIAEGVIPESVSYDVATPEANGLMSSEDKATLDNLKTNAVTTDASGFVQKSPIKFRNYDGGIELDITGKTETSFDLDMRSPDGSSIVTITGDELFGEKTSAITMNGDATFTMNDKDVKGITDVVGSSADGTKLATDKAVKDAIDAIEIPDPLPAGGTDGQVLTKTADGEAWEDIPDYENATIEYDGLMSAADKAKLDGIQAGADKLPDGAMAGQYLRYNGSSAYWFNIPIAGAQTDGLMTSEDKQKLNGIEEGANRLPDTTSAGQVLTVVENEESGLGYAWQDAPEPDLTGMPAFEDVMGTDCLAKVGEGGQREFVPQLMILPSDYDPSSGTPPESFAAIGMNSDKPTVFANGDNATIGISGVGAKFQIGENYVTSITNDVTNDVLTDDARAHALATAKAVKDYADANGVKYDLDEMGHISCEDVDLNTIEPGMYLVDSVTPKWADAGETELVDPADVTQMPDCFVDGMGGTGTILVYDYYNKGQTGGTGGTSTNNSSRRFIFCRYGSSTDKRLFYLDASRGYVTRNDWTEVLNSSSLIPINRGGTGVTSEDALVQLVFNSTSTPKASATQYGVVKFASDEDFKAYMGNA